MLSLGSRFGCALLAIARQWTPRSLWNATSWITVPSSVAFSSVPLWSGAAAAIVAIAIFSQIIAAFSQSLCLNLGLLIASVLGLMWGFRSPISGSARRRSEIWLTLSVVLLLWPTWLTTQLEMTHWLPLSVWSSIWTSDLCAVVLALLSWAIPVALLTQWLRSWNPGWSSTPSAVPADRSAKTSHRFEAASTASSVVITTGFAVGLASMAVIVGPLLGLWWPAWTAMLAVAGLLAWQTRQEAVVSLTAANAVPETVPAAPISDMRPCDPQESPSQLVTGSAVLPALCSLVLLGIAGFQATTLLQLLAESAALTLPAQLFFAACVAGGVALGLRGATSSSIAPLSASWQWWAIICAGQLLLAGQWIDINFWLTSHILSPWLLELSRGLLIAVLVGPVGVWLGRQCRNHLSTSAVSTPLAMRSLSIQFLIGACVGILTQPILPDLMQRLWFVAGAAAAGYLALRFLELRSQAFPRADSKSQGVTQSESTSVWRRAGFALSVTGIAAVAIGALTPGHWSAKRAVKLLFSTPALMGARSGWPTSQLTELDDVQLIDSAVGRQGHWTLWRQRGAEVVVRGRGIPRGALSTQAEWSPQYAPEVASTVWPLVLVDQPARVLMFGVGSSAALQSALAFPVSEVVACESDPALLQLLRRSALRDDQFNPLTDFRCRTIYQPTGWIALPTQEMFDVIVSNPNPAILADASSEMTAEFYQRSARRLTERGVFCQRVTSVDFGPQPLLCAAMSLQQAFPATACVEVGPGEYLLLGAHAAESLVRADLPARLEMPHVSYVLSRCNWDWSLPLNLTAYDGAALAEAAAEIGARPQSISDAWLPFYTPRELMRWAPKLQETASLFQKSRSTASVFPLLAEGTNPVVTPAKTARKSRYLEWIGPTAEDPALLRRLSEAVTQQQLVMRYPDTHWWEYRKELRQQLQNHPRTGLQKHSQLSAADGKRWHPEDRQRKAYFETLGAALAAEQPTAQQLQAIEQQLEPYDPLLTLFAHQELAELYAKVDISPARESQHRLHMIYYAARGDASVRNVAAAIDHIVQHADSTSNDRERFEVLNGLLQTLRSRWEVRNTRPPKSVRVTQQEIERSLLSAERALELMNSLADSAGINPRAWSNRQAVLERMLLRPFRSYRDQLAAHTRDSERRTRELLRKATDIDGATPSESIPAPAMNGLMAN